MPETAKKQTRQRKSVPEKVKAHRAARKAEEEEKKQRLRENMAIARMKLNEKRKQQQIVREKVAANMPITDEERELLEWKAHRSAGPNNPKTRTQKEKETIAKAAKLMMKPQNIAELRQLVEDTAARHKYNPIDELIQLSTSPDVPEKDKIQIHKTLLPFLLPQLPPQKPQSGAQAAGGVKVTIARFDLTGGSDKPQKALHEEAPVTVTVEEGDEE